VLLLFAAKDVAVAAAAAAAAVDDNDDPAMLPAASTVPYRILHTRVSLLLLLLFSNISTISRLVGWSVGRSAHIIVCHLLFLYMSPSPSYSFVSISTSTIAVAVIVASSSRYAAASAVIDTTGTNVCLQLFLSSMIHLQYLETFR